MKSRTKRQLKNFVLYALIAVFVIGGGFLVWLPVGDPAPQPTPLPPLNELPVQDLPPDQSGTVPDGGAVPVGP